MIQMKNNNETVFFNFINVDNLKWEDTENSH